MFFEKSFHDPTKFNMIFIGNNIRDNFFSLEATLSVAYTNNFDVEIFDNFIDLSFHIKRIFTPKKNFEAF